MAIDLGGIYVSFTGDTSKLEADIARAQALAKQGGSDMSAAFNASAATAYKLSSAIDSVTASTQKLISAQRQLISASQSSSAAAVEGTRKEEAALIALFDLQMDVAKAPRAAAPAGTSSTSGVGMDPAVIASISEMGAASEASAVQVAALGAAAAKAGLPVAELGIVSKSTALSVAGLATASAAAARPIAGLGTAAASSAVPLAALASAANSPAVAAGVNNATQLGTAVAGAGTAAAKAAPQFGAMSAAQQTSATWFASLAGNATQATAATAKTTTAVSQFGRAAQVAGQQTQSFVGLIPGLGRAAETFINMIPGLGNAILKIFPVLGAVALAEGIYRIGEAIYSVWEKTDPLIQAEKELAEATRQNDQEFQNLGKTLDHINIERITVELGRAAGARLSAFYDESAAKADEARIKELGELIERTKKKIGEEADLKSFFGNPLKAANPFEIGIKYGEIRDSQAQAKNIEKYEDEVRVLNEKLKVSKAQQALDNEKSSKDTAVEGAQTSLAAISNQIAANRRLADAKRQAVENSLATARQAEDAQIAGAESAHVRTIATAEQDLQIAQQRASALKQIDDVELAAHIAMLRRKAGAESVGKDSQQRATIGVTIKGEIDTAQAENARKQIDLDAKVAAAAAKVGQVRATVARESKVELDALVRESENLLDRNTAALEEATERLAELRQQANVRIEETQAKGGGELQQIQIQGQKIQLERQYGLELGHTLSQQVQYLEQIASLESEGRAAKVAGLQTELQIAQAAQAEAAARSSAALLTGDTREATRAGDEEVRSKVKAAEVQQQINELRAQANNADYEAQTRILELKRRESIAGSFAQAGQQVPGAIGGALAKGIIDGKHIGQDIRQSLRGIGQELLGNVLRQTIAKLVTELGVNTAAQGALAAVTGGHIGVMLAHGGIMVAHGAAVLANTIATILNTVWTAILTAVETVKAFFGFAEGGRPPVGVPSIIGEKGPELWVPDQAGIIVPAGKFNIQAGAKSGAAGLPSQRSLNLGSLGTPPPDKTFAATPPPAANTATARDGTTIHLHGAQFHGVQNVRELMREISQYSKTQSPRFSPYAR